MDRLVIIFTIMTIVSCDSSNKRNTDKSDTDLTSNESCIGFFKSADSFEILNSKKANDSPSSLTDTTICKGWTLTIIEIEKIIKDSKIISGPDWHHLFDHLPCSMAGQIKQNEITFDFQINAGSWLTLTCKDSTIVFGNFNRDNEHLFISTALDTSEE